MEMVAVGTRGSSEAVHRPWHVRPGKNTPLDPWLVPPDATGEKRVAGKRRRAMRLSALFEEFCDYLRVEKEAAPKTVTTYRSRFEDFMEFARLEAQQPSPCPIPEPGRRT
jgi:hypothetical protein